MKFFVTPAFAEFVVRNLQTLPPTKELFLVVRKAEIAKEDVPNVISHLESLIKHIRNIEPECIHLVVHLMVAYPEEGFLLV